MGTLQWTTDPAALPTSRRFDLVFVALPFTHLPDRAFGVWLSKLWELVVHGGVLAFNVHNEVLNRLGGEAGGRLRLHRALGSVSPFG
ncbi:MAG: hypothetical protein ACLP50_12875 [Solirubrobacteraceae bacterium]